METIDLKGSLRGTVTPCRGSVQSGIIAASILRKRGFENFDVCFGSMAACQAIGCPIATNQRNFAINIKLEPASPRR